MLCFAAFADMHKPMMHNRRIRVIAGVCPVIADSWGTLAERVWIGGFAYVTKLCVDRKFLQAVVVLSYASKWRATRWPAVQKTSTKAMQIDLCRLLVLITSRGVEDLCLGKNVPWQLAALIEDQKCMEVGGTPES